VSDRVTVPRVGSGRAASTLVTRPLQIAPVTSSWRARRAGSATPLSHRCSSPTAPRSSSGWAD